MNTRPATGISLGHAPKATGRSRFRSGEAAISTSPTKPSERQGALLFVLIYLALAVGVITAAFFYHRSHARQFRVEVERQLSSIAALKVSEIAQYRQERLNDAWVLFENPAFSAAVAGFLGQPSDANAQAQLRSWLSKYPAYLDYAGVVLYDTTGARRLFIPDTMASDNPADAQLALAVLAEGKPHFRDFYRSPSARLVYCSILVPVSGARGDNSPVGVVELRIDPHAHLYPFIKRWPTPSRTAETLLVRRDGDDALFLNELKFRSDTALNFRISVDQSDTPAVMAVLGRTGTVQGRDYRGVPVIASLSAVPNSPWFLVARMDHAELFAPLDERLHQMVATVIALLIAAGAGLGFIVRQRSIHYFREQAAGARALSELSTHQDALLATVPDLIVEMTETLEYSWANPAGLEFFGVDVVGRTADSYFTNDTTTLGVLQSLVNGTERLLTTESWQERSDGAKRLLAWRCTALNDPGGSVRGVLASARDITDQRRAEQELALRARVAKIFLTVPDDQTYAQVLGVILEATQSPQGTFGYLDEAGRLVVPAEVPSTETHPELGLGRALPREEWEQSSWRKALLEKQPSRSNAPPGSAADSKLARKRQLCVPMLLRDEVVGLLQIAGRGSDYTNDDLALLEAIAGYVAPVLHAQLQRQRHEADLLQRNDEMMRFVYTASHDLKSPLVTVTTFLGFLEKDIRLSNHEAIVKDFGFIRGAAIKMSRLLDELLELSRVGRKANPEVEVTLQALVAEAAELTAGRLAARGISVQVTDKPLLFVGDRQRLVEVFQNLLDNAAKFMGPQAEPQIIVGAEPSREGPIIYVRDNGLGIDPRHRHKLFGLFEKLDPHSEGSGIGLAMIKRIVEVHGGRIWAESEGLGMGTTFRFILAKARIASEEELKSARKEEPS